MFQDNNMRLKLPPAKRNVSALLAVAQDEISAIRDRFFLGIYLHKQDLKQATTNT